MPRIDDVQLTIIPDRIRNRAKVVVSCLVEFSEFEVNAMNILGLRYKLDCRILEEDIYMLPKQSPVVTFLHQDFPRPMSGVEQYEQAKFEVVVPTSDLREHDFGKDKLIAELKLQDEETGRWVVGRSQVVAIDLAGY
jgi:hypothetical protein